jgi:hypothetical protein
VTSRPIIADHTATVRSIIPGVTRISVSGRPILPPGAPALYLPECRPFFKPVLPALPALPRFGTWGGGSTARHVGLNPEADAGASARLVVHILDRGSDGDDPSGGPTGSVRCERHPRVGSHSQTQLESPLQSPVGPTDLALAHRRLASPPARWHGGGPATRRLRNAPPPRLGRPPGRSSWPPRSALQVRVEPRLQTPGDHGGSPARCAGKAQPSRCLLACSTTLAASRTALESPSTRVSRFRARPAARRHCGRGRAGWHR